VSTTATKTRPKHLQLTAIRLPIPGIVSIMHRISGATLFLMLPLLLWLLQSSLAGEKPFAAFRAMVGNPLVKIVLLGLLWGYLHHLFAGLRHLFLDMHMGLELESARFSAKLVLAAGLIVTVLVGAKLW
jgi:succinate dehydrogenase / fumarate reductase cytochrome b subunit